MGINMGMNSGYPSTLGSNRSPISGSGMQNPTTNYNDPINITIQSSIARCIKLGLIDPNQVPAELMIGASGGMSPGMSGGMSPGMSGGMSPGMSGGISGGMSPGMSGGMGRASNLISQTGFGNTATQNHTNSDLSKLLNSIF